MTGHASRLLACFLAAVAATTMIVGASKSAGQATPGMGRALLASDTSDPGNDENSGSSSVSGTHYSSGNHDGGKAHGGKGDDRNHHSGQHRGGRPSWWRPKASDHLQWQYQIGTLFNVTTDFIEGIQVCRGNAKRFWNPCAASDAHCCLVGPVVLLAWLKDYKHYGLPSPMLVH